MKNYISPVKSAAFLLLGFAFLFVLPSCDEEEEEQPQYNEVTAVFSATAAGNTVTFVNASVNADTYSWDFGDGNNSTEENPVHTYDAPGTYNVTLSASNPEYSDDVSMDVVTEHAGPISSILVGQTWIAIRENHAAYILGPEAGMGATYQDLDPVWFTWGDSDGAHQDLIARYSLANDEYTFNTDGTYDVDFHGDFWGEFGVWSGVEGADEENIEIGDGGTLPLNTNGENVDAFVAGTWEWVVDETAKTLEVKGAGAHILNPRLKNDIYSYDVGTGITYQVERIVQGTEADTLIVYVLCNDGANDLVEYHVMAAYHGTVPDMKEPPPPQYEQSVNSTDIGHTFLSEEGAYSGVGSVDGPYTVTYGATADGEVCTEFIRGADNETFRWANYLMRTDQAEIDFSTGTTVVVDVYFPSTNVYTGDLTQTVWIRFIDESRLGGSFWQEYIQLESAEVTPDTWTTLTFDFATPIADGAAAGNSPDGVMIEFGGSNHLVGGTFYAKDWRIE